MIFALLLLAALFLAWSNGANDNFKGVATLYGSAAADFRKSLLGAGLTTAQGSMVSVSLAGALARSFSGKGLIPAAALDAAALTAIRAGRRRHHLPGDVDRHADLDHPCADRRARRSRPFRGGGGTDGVGGLRRAGGRRRPEDRIRR